MMRRRLLLLGLALPTLGACGHEPTDPAPSAQVQQAIVGFPSRVDTALLDSVGLTIVGVRAAPPAAWVSGTSDELSRLAANAAVSYVLTLYLLPGDTVGVFVAFRDRPTTADSLSDADRALVTAVGGRITFVYAIIPAIAARVPVWGVPTLKTDSSVTGLEMDTPVTAALK